MTNGERIVDLTWFWSLIYNRCIYIDKSVLLSHNNYDNDKCTIVSHLGINISSGY